VAVQQQYSGVVFGIFVNIGTGIRGLSMRGKSYLLATVSSLALFGAVNVAAAADLPARVPVKAPVVAAAPFNWTGFYIGIAGGGAWLDHKQTTFENNGACDNFQGNNFTAVCSFRASGGTFGGFAGYNIQ